MATITIRGKISNRSGQGLANLRIEAWDKDALIDDFVGEATSNDQGSFSISFTQSRFRELFFDRRPDIYFRIYAGDQLISTTEHAVLWNLENSKHVVEIIVDYDGGTGTTEDPDNKINNKNYLLNGQVFNSDGMPLPGYNVAAFIISIDDTRQVAKGVTDSNGNYSMGFLPTNLKSLPDIQMRAYGENDEHNFTASAISYNVSGNVTIDIIVPVSEVRAIPEFEMVLKDLRPYLGGNKINKVLEDEQVQQISYLSNKTGYDSRIVAMAVSAHQIGETLGISPSHVYALFRSGVPGDESAIKSLPAKTLEDALQKAIEKNIIADKQDIQETAKALAGKATDHLLNSKPEAAISSMNDILSLRLNDSQKNKFAALYKLDGADAPKFWSSLQQNGFSPETISNLRLDGKLGYLTGQNAPLMKKLYAAFPMKSDEELAANGLYKASVWKELVADALPDGLTADEYARHLANQVKISYPTAVAGEMINRKEIDLGSNVPTPELYGFFNKNKAQHIIGMDPVKQWDGYNELTVPAKAAAKTFERLYQISPSDESMVTLSKAGITSSYQIANYTEKEFVNAFGASFSNPLEVKKVFVKAKEVYSAALNIATGYITQRASPNVYAITGVQEKMQHKSFVNAESKTMAKAMQQTIAYPTLEDLFGNMDYCACDHCKSVLSPAAYLVELLRFIDLSDIAHSGANPIDALTARRPDIEHILLSCENTNMTLPYIDLVNEILEHYILHGNLDELKGHDVLESTKQADLLAEPQFVEKSVYEKSVSGNDLQSKAFPYNLPFHQPLETLRRLFHMWDVSLEQSMAVFATPLSSRKEAMGLSEEEYKMLTDSTFKKLPLYFGEPANNTLALLNMALANGKDFSRRLGLKYEELIQLLKTNFINPGITLTPALQKLGINLADIQRFYDGLISNAALDSKIPAAIDPADYNGNVREWLHANRQLIMGLITLVDVGDPDVECNFATVELRFALPKEEENKLNALAYHKFHRFLRLMKKTGWNIATTDAVLKALLPVPAGELTEAQIDTVFITLLDRMGNFIKLANLLDYSEKKFPQLLFLLDADNPLPQRQEQLGKITKLNIAELLELSLITAIDPFAADFEDDEPSLTRFIVLAQQLKTHSLKVVDLSYLLRHQDNTGKLTPGDDSLLKNIKLIKDAINQVEKENSIAPDNADFNFAKSKMLLVYDADSTDNFFGLLQGTHTYVQPFETVADGLPAKLVNKDARLGLDPFKKELTYTGLLSAITKDSLINEVNNLLVADIGDDATSADLISFKAGITTALNALFTQSNADLTNLGNNHPELKVILDAVLPENNPAKQSNKLVELILPELKATLKANAVRQTLIGILKADDALVHTLSGDKNIAHAAADVNESLLYDFMQLERKTVFNENKRYTFYIDVPATDHYNLYVSGPENTVITLSVNDAVLIGHAIIGVNKEVTNTTGVQLKAGILHAVSLKVEALTAGNSVALSWRTKGVAKVLIPHTAMYDGDRVGFAKSSLVRITKAIQLNKLLKLTPLELEYFAASNPATKNFIRELPVAIGIEVDDLHALWEKIAWLIWFQGIKKENEPEEHTWLSVLLNPDLKNVQLQYLLESFNGWKEPDLVSVLNRFGYTRADLSVLSKLRKIMGAMSLITAIGYPAAQSLTWITTDPGYDDVAAIKAIIRANVTEAVWQESMQSVNDVVRNNLRDALVSYILQYKKPSDEITSPDKLYEYFLIDVSMDACMKTSRIRQALSTVQLFIQRCLLNLEPTVDPASIRAEQWAWMKRYRIWEANRKVFLYPENWLEPELRDNKSPLFKELEGELMQQEITDESAELAFLNYLKKLDDIAKLEIAGMYLDEDIDGNPTDDVLHVIGRTNGNTRQHYYRRYERGVWTAWEKISLNIEGEHLFPIIWRKRLFIFWLNTVEKAQAPDKSVKLASLGDTPWGNRLRKNVEVNICWGEYYKGKWTSPKSTEINKPLILSDLAEFDKRLLSLYGRKEFVENPTGKFRERLVFYVKYGVAYYASWNPKKLGGYGGTFTFTSKNAPPYVTQMHDVSLYENVAQFNDTSYAREEAMEDYSRIFRTGRKWSVSVIQPANASTALVTENILTKKSVLTNGLTILPLNHPVANQFEAPLSYADEHSTLFVEPKEKITTVNEMEVFYPPILRPIEIIEPPILVAPPRIGWPPKDIFDPGDIIRNPMEKWTNGGLDINQNLNKLLPDMSTFTLGNKIFGLGAQDKITNKSVKI